MSKLGLLEVLVSIQWITWWDIPSGYGPSGPQYCLLWQAETLCSYITVRGALPASSFLPFFSPVDPGFWRGVSTWMKVLAAANTLPLISCSKYNIPPRTLMAGDLQKKKSQRCPTTSLLSLFLFPSPQNLLSPTSLEFLVVIYDWSLLSRWD